LGKVAIANAKLVYRTFKDICRSQRWQVLAKKGAGLQRLLWASTSTKNPKYRDVLYVEELIGPDTVNTIPPATMDAFRDHGRSRPSLQENLGEAIEVMESLKRVGISMTEVTDRLLDEGVGLFAESFDHLLAAIAKKREEILGLRT
jgi:transaldolase